MTKIRIIKVTTQAYLDSETQLYELERWTGRVWEPVDERRFPTKKECDRIGELENPGNHRR